MLSYKKPHFIYFYLLTGIKSDVILHKKKLFPFSTYQRKAAFFPFFSQSATAGPKSGPIGRAVT
jgi:hypothetical protein